MANQHDLKTVCQEPNLKKCGVEVLRIHKTFPFLVPNFNLTMWNGIIIFEDEQVAVTISTPYFPSIKDFSIFSKLKIVEKLKKKIKDYQTLPGNQNSGLFQFLDFLRSSKTDIGKEIGFDKNIKLGDYISHMKQECHRYKQILNELKQLQNECIETCNGDISEVSLRAVDIRGIDHKLVVGLPPDYPAKRPIVIDVDLPELALAELNQAETIIVMFNTFQTLVDSFQEFWSAYDTLIKSTWVIDPEHPSFKDTHCRIVIGENISMLVTLNPQDINTCPDIKFLGPENAVVPFINSMEKNLKTVGWDEDISIVENLLSLLGLPEFPQPNIESQTVPQQDECSICFMMRLDDQALPTKLCNNSKCNSYFHVICLAQWFQAVPTNETSFNLISGDCPCCGEKVLCPIKMN